MSTATAEDGFGFVLRFERRYSMAHRLRSGEAPNCRIPHGHDEVVEIEIVEQSNQPLDSETNMLVEFSRIKGRWFEWIDRAVDHSFHLDSQDPLVRHFQENEPELVAKLLLTPGDPTTEIRCACFAAKLNAFLQDENPNFICRKITIQETPTNSVSFYPQKTAQPVSSDLAHWWNRSDQSVNDL